MHAKTVCDVNPGINKKIFKQKTILGVIGSLILAEK